MSSEHGENSNTGSIDGDFGSIRDPIIAFEDNKGTINEGDALQNVLNLGGMFSGETLETILKINRYVWFKSQEGIYVKVPANGVAVRELQGNELGFKWLKAPKGEPTVVKISANSMEIISKLMLIASASSTRNLNHICTTQNGRQSQAGNSLRLSTKLVQEENNLINFIPKGSNGILVREEAPIEYEGQTSNTVEPDEFEDSEDEIDNFPLRPTFGTDISQSMRSRDSNSKGIAGITTDQYTKNGFPDQRRIEMGQELLIKGVRCLEFSAEDLKDSYKQRAKTVRFLDGFIHFTRDSLGLIASLPETTGLEPSVGESLVVNGALMSLIKPLNLKDLIFPEKSSKANLGSLIQRLDLFQGDDLDLQDRLCNLTFDTDISSNKENIDEFFINFDLLKAEVRLFHMESFFTPKALGQILLSKLVQAYRPLYVKIMTKYRHKRMPTDTELEPLIRQRCLEIKAHRFLYHQQLATQNTFSINAINGNGASTGGYQFKPKNQKENPSKKNIKCFYCNKAGHFKYQCNKRIRNTKNT